ICTPPSTAYLEDQFHKARSLGLNMLRFHIKVPDPRYLEVADRLGMLIWYDLPNAGHLTDASAARLKQTMEGMLARDGNHPSVVIWTLINEDWGIRTCDDPGHRRWLMDMVDWLKARDPTRLVCDNSPCHGNFHVKGDLDDFHYYRSVPERRDEWDALTAEFAQGAAWTWSPFGDGVRKGDEVKIVSEFGVWGLPQPEQVKIDGAEPWWMETGQLWGEGAAYPHGIEGRFASLGLGKVFGSLENLVTAAQWYQFANLKYEIEVMRGWPQIQGYVITELTDVHWESNGLMDMNRNLRVFHDRLTEINADVIILPKPSRYAATAGQPWLIDLAIATGGTVLPRGVLHWSMNDLSGEIGFAGADALTVTDLGVLRLVMPDLATNQMMTLHLALICEGRTVARNQVDVAVYTPRTTQDLPSVATDDPELADRARALGYAVVTAAAADVTLTHALYNADIRAMQAGKRFLVLADGTMKTHGNLRVEERGREQPFIPVVDATPGVPVQAQVPLPNITLMQRHGTMWRGDWIAGFSWIRRDGVFADLPGGPLIDLSFSDVVPRHVMGGFSGWEFGGPVHAGLVVGWVHKPAALIAERRVGKGALVASTFRLTGHPPGQDPVADALFDRLIRLAAVVQTDP
ncbi:MAG: glycoside hydrolase family 2, partial [Candidatus Saccharibacteria bacterium]|nr:glycoside hydrolase family 2 [Pseudorhodobacter sp.]